MMWRKLNFLQCLDCKAKREARKARAELLGRIDAALHSEALTLRQLEDLLIEAYYDCRRCAEYQALEHVIQTRRAVRANVIGKLVAATADGSLEMLTEALQSAAGARDIDCASSQEWQAAKQLLSKLEALNGLREAMADRKLAELEAALSRARPCCSSAAPDIEAGENLRVELLLERLAVEGGDVKEMEDALKLARQRALLETLGPLITEVEDTLASTRAKNLVLEALASAIASGAKAELEAAIEFSLATLGEDHEAVQGACGLLEKYIPVKLVSKSLACVDKEAVERMAKPADLPDEMLLQQEIMSVPGGIACFYCGGTGFLFRRRPTRLDRCLQEASTQKPDSAVCDSATIAPSSEPVMQKVASVSSAPLEEGATWLFDDGHGGWAVYNEDMARLLEEAWWVGSGAVLQIKGPLFTYEVDMTSMVQRNMKTGTERRVYRLPHDDEEAAELLDGELHEPFSNEVMQRSDADVEADQVSCEGQQGCGRVAVAADAAEEWEPHTSQLHFQSPKQRKTVSSSSSVSSRSSSASSSSQRATSALHSDSGASSEFEAASRGTSPRDRAPNHPCSSVVQRDSEVLGRCCNDESTLDFQPLPRDGGRPGGIQLELVSSSSSSSSLSSSAHKLNGKAAATPFYHLASVGTWLQVKPVAQCQQLREEDAAAAEGSAPAAEALTRPCWICRGSGRTSKWLSGLQPCALHPDRDLPCCICFGESRYGLSLDCQHYYCGDCIVLALEAILEQGQFPAYCPQCRAEAMGAPTVGAIEDVALSFLVQRKVITKAFFFRFSRQQQQEQLQQTGISRDFGCPANCGLSLLVQHPSYRADLGKPLVIGKSVGITVGECPCGALCCVVCKELVQEQPHECLMQVDGTVEPEDPETLQLLSQIGKRCPKCSQFIEKNEGCEVMNCGTKAHGKLSDMIRNGGCGCAFKWPTMEVIESDYVDLDNQRKRGRVVTARQLKGHPKCARKTCRYFRSVDDEMLPPAEGHIRQVRSHGGDFCCAACSDEAGQHSESCHKVSFFVARVS